MAQNKKTDYMLSGWYMYIALFVNCKNSKKSTKYFDASESVNQCPKKCFPDGPFEKKSMLKKLQATEGNTTNRDTQTDWQRHSMQTYKTGVKHTFSIV